MSNEVMKNDSKESKYLLKVKALEDLNDYIRKMPFEKHELDYLLKKIQFEINMIEYQLEKELGQRELSKLRQSIAN